MDNIRQHEELSLSVLVALLPEFQWRSTPAVQLLRRWMVTFSRSRKEKTMANLANEIIDATNGVGASVKRREDLYKMAEANRAFSTAATVEFRNWQTNG